MDPQITVDGAVELRKAFRTIDRDLGKALAGANKNAAQHVVKAALPDVPVQSGRLKKSVRALGSQRSGRVIAGRATVPYAASVHWGRKRGNVGRPPGNRKGRNPIPKNPFLWEAARREVPRIEPEYRATIMDLIETATRRQAAQ